MKISEILDYVAFGGKLKCDIISGEMKVGEKTIRSRIKFYEDVDLEEWHAETQEQAFAMLEKAFMRYKASNPDAGRMESRYMNNEETTFTPDVVYGDARSVAVARFDVILFMYIKTGILNWVGLEDKFFWRSEKVGDLYVFRSWIYPWGLPKEMRKKIENKEVK